MENQAKSLPRGLQWMGLIVVGLGTAELAAGIGAFFTRQELIRVNLGGPLLLWLGVSLLQRRDGARIWGTIACGLVLASALIGSGRLVYRLAADSGGPAGAPELVPAGEVVALPRNHRPLQVWLERRLPIWAQAAGISCLALVSALGIRTLRSARKAGGFGFQRSERLSRELRRKAVAAGILGALGAGGLAFLDTKLPPSEDQSDWLLGDENSFHLIAWGTRLGDLEYAVFFADAPVPLKRPSYRKGQQGGGCILSLPDGRQLRLPGRHRLYQLTSADGIVRTSDRIVPPDRLVAFLGKARRSSGPPPTLVSFEAWLDKP